MKRFLLATVALSMLAAPAMAQSGNYRHDGNRHDARPHHSQMIQKKKVVRKATVRPHWKAGHRFDRKTRYVVVNDYRRHHLRQPARGQHWVRVDNQYLLVGITSGIIAALVNAH